MTTHAPDHATCARLVRTAATRLKRCEFPTAKQYWLEKDLQSFMLAEARSAMKRHGIASAKTGFRAPIPNWWPAAGDVDLVVEAATPNECRFDLYELKWCNHNKMEEALWDAVKLLNAHELPEVRNTYLVFGAPTRWWEKDVVGVRCFDASETNMSKILDEFPARWNAVVKGGTGRPKSVPAKVSIEPVTASRLAVGNVTYELRAVALRPTGSSIATV